MSRIDREPKVTKLDTTTAERKDAQDQIKGNIARTRRVGHAPLVAILGTGLAVGAWFGIDALNGDDDGNAKSPALNPDRTVSAPANSGEVSNVSIEGIQTAATKEQIKQAQTLIDGSLSPDEAVVQMGQRLNVYANSGKLDPNTTDLILTDKSTREGDLILKAVYGDNINEAKKSAQETIRIERAAVFDIDRIGNVRLSTEVVPDVSTLVDMKDGTFQIQYDEINTDSTNSENAKRDVDFRTQATISNTTGNWVIINTESLGTIE